MGQSALLVATWDTLGWVLYREGKLDEAQNYIQAAWYGDFEPEVGLHLAAIQAARGQKSAALATDELAIAAFPPANGRSADGQRKLQAQAEELRKEGAKAPGGDDRAALQKLRVIPLGKAGGRSGTAQYRVLLRAGKPVRAEPAGDRTVAGAQELLAKADLGRLFPAGADASLVKVAFFNCHSGVCELVFGQ